MTVENKQIVDFVSIIQDETTAVMTISDHLDWMDEEHHMKLLQDKIYMYMDVVENGEIYERYPKAKGKKIRISVIAKYDLTDNAQIFLKKIEQYLLENNFQFAWKRLV